MSFPARAGRKSDKLGWSGGESHGETDKWVSSRNVTGSKNTRNNRGHAELTEPSSDQLWSRRGLSSDQLWSRESVSYCFSYLFN